MVSSQIIKDHNGVLKIESEIGKGTGVNVTLPLSQKTVAIISSIIIQNSAKYIVSRGFLIIYNVE